MLKILLTNKIVNKIIVFISYCLIFIILSRFLSCVIYFAGMPYDTAKIFGIGLSTGLILNNYIYGNS